MELPQILVPVAVQALIKNPQRLLGLIAGVIALVAVLATGGVLSSVEGSSSGETGKPTEGQSTIAVKKADGSSPGHCQLHGINPEEVVRNTDNHGVFHWKFEPGKHTVSASCLVLSPATSSKNTLEGETTFTVEDSPVTVIITVK